MTDLPTAYTTRVAELLRDLGYRSQIIGDGAGIGSAAGGLKFVAFSPSEGTLQFRCAISISNKPFPLKPVNLFNSQWRFSKLYIDDSGDLELELDFFLDPDRDEASENLSNWVASFESSIFSLKNLLDERSEQPALTEQKD